ncbi:four-carbon acid sugar kinase family protein [Streptomyces sp. 7-21]|uniref:four-carbon acid sugar kinase family protein n=1 Tax=Streptomyces sp. 7-21 TaxID=2802283 RepID=UPI00191DCF5B|nr:four-carbon acid sugar kinase family protein [Streptomyces sp. 7-21]MBL1066650.1 four-carbon acid sugar kinase family protein [Streptomyces sp. 7-21]
MTTHAILLVADDLSGAADCAVPFAVRGMRSTVALTDAADRRDTAAVTGPVTVVDTDSRYLPPGEARRRVAGELLRHGSGRLLFKKLDSTLRGNLVPEIDALRAHGGGSSPVICTPAVPATGRTVRDGALFVHGTPLPDSGAWDAEPGPAPRTVAEALRPLPVTEVPLRAVRGPRAQLTELLAAAARESRVAVCDAETDADLRAIAETGLALPRPPRWAGAAGLAAALARAVAPGAGPAAPPAPLALTGPVLTVVGSASSVAAAQADALARRCPGRTLALTARQALAGDAAAHAARLAALLPPRGEALLRLVPDGPPDPALARRLVSRLGDIAAPAARRAGLLVLTGGETARAVLTRCGAPALEILAAPAPGAVLGRVPGPAPRYVVTKPGGFGTPRTLADILDVLGVTGVTGVRTAPAAGAGAPAAEDAPLLEETP